MAAPLFQFVRNFVCVVRSLSPADGLAFAIPFPQAPSPLHLVNCTELFLATGQAAAVYLLFKASCYDITFGFNDFHRSKRLLKDLDRLSITESQGSAEHTILRHGLTADRAGACQRQLVGVCEFLIACAYVFLLANSLHATGPSHPHPIYRSLIVMELCVAYLLTVMWRSLWAKVSAAESCSALAAQLQVKGAVSNLKVLELADDCGFTNMMDAVTVIDPLFTPSCRFQGDGLKADLTAIHALIADSKDQEREELISYLLTRSNRLSVESVIAGFVFLFNLTAGVAYMVGILAFYFPNAGSTPGTVSQIAHVLMFKMSRANAEWYGIFTGDLAWTLEPLLVLASPWLIQRFTKEVEKAPKPKSD